MISIHTRADKIHHRLREQLDEGFASADRCSVARGIDHVLRAKADKDLQRLHGMSAVGLAQRIRAGLKADPRSLREEFDELGTPMLESLGVAFLENWALANEHHRNRPSMIFALERLMPEAFDFICKGLDAQRVIQASIPLGQSIDWLPRPFKSRAEAFELAAESCLPSSSPRRSL